MGRQRAARAIVGSFLTLGMLATGTACDAGNSVEAAQTAVIAARTVLPGAQATVQAGATLVSNALSTVQPVIAMVRGMLQGVSVNVSTTPSDAQPADVADVSIEGTDSQGRLGQLDAQTRETAARAALVAVSQYYPKATIVLKVVDGSGNTLIDGSVAPGQAPSIQ
jgi:hypothetical protein